MGQLGLIDMGGFWPGKGWYHGDIGGYLILGWHYLEHKDCWRHLGHWWEIRDSTSTLPKQHSDSDFTSSSLISNILNPIIHQSPVVPTRNKDFDGWWRRRPKAVISLSFSFKILLIGVSSAANSSSSHVHDCFDHMPSWTTWPHSPNSPYTFYMEWLK